MSNTSLHTYFHRLMTELARELRNDELPVEPSRRESTTIDIVVESIPLQVVYSPEDRPEHIVLICDFGVTPALERVAVLERLMHLNFVFAGSNVHVGLEPLADKVVLIQYLRLVGLDAPTLLDAATRVALLARRWQRDHLLDTPLLPPERAAGPFIRA